MHFALVVQWIERPRPKGQIWVRFLSRAQKINTLQVFYFMYTHKESDRGVGRRGNLVSPPCRKLFKTVGFEGGAKRRRVLGRAASRIPVEGTNKMSAKHFVSVKF